MSRRSLLLEDSSKESQTDSSVIDNINDGDNISPLPGQYTRTNTWKGISYPGFAESSPMIPQ